MDVHRLWAPGRMKYIEEMKARKRAWTKEEDECLFCVKLAEPDGPGNLVLLRREQTALMLNLYPYNPGHLMLAPFRHVGALRDLSAEEGRELLELLALAEGLLARAFEPEGLNVGMNLGRSAGAGVVGHLHLHVVPRWTGDTNFMPLTAGTKVMVEEVAETYARLAAVLAGMQLDGTPGCPG
jgi:ATP adenylyltransferase